MSIIEQTLDKYGLKNQKLKLIEEMSELIQAILKDGNVAEELADVQIMLDQLKIAYPDWITWEQIKLNKLKES